jgi:hypothetical protein
MQGSPDQKPQSAPSLFNWHVVHVLMMCALGEAEFLGLSPAEQKLLREATSPTWGDAGPPVSACEAPLLQSLHRKGLIYFDIPVDPGDRFSIPPLEVGRWGACGQGWRGGGGQGVWGRVGGRLGGVGRVMCEGEGISGGGAEWPSLAADMYEHHCNRKV